MEWEGMTKRWSNKEVSASLSDLGVAQAILYDLEDKLTETEHALVESERHLRLLRAVAEAAEEFKEEMLCYSTGVSCLSEENMKVKDGALTEAIGAWRKHKNN
jgi:hypothetical protein